MQNKRMLETQPHLLVVDDDARIRDLLSQYLLGNGFLVTTASDAASTRILMESLRFDLLVLDVMMPGETGVELTEDLYQKGDGTPILLLTAMGDVSDRIQGLRAGADEYLSKPFEPQELLLRIRAILRRASVSLPSQGHMVRIGALQFDQKKGILYQGDQEVPLTTAETTLLCALVSEAGIVQSREKLADICGLTANPRTVDVQITRLRRKLEEDSRIPQYLQTIRNQGYVLWTH